MDLEGAVKDDGVCVGVGGDLEGAAPWDPETRRISSTAGPSPSTSTSKLRGLLMEKSSLQGPTSASTSC